MIADSHMHTSFSTDSEAPMEEMVQKAIELGLDNICFTDHYDKDFGGDFHQMGEEEAFQLDTESYLRSIERVQEKYEGLIEIRAGVELGLQLHLKEWLSNYVNEYPFDFVIGSMHLLDGNDPAIPGKIPEGSQKELLRRYFAATAENLDSFHGFQSLGHMDYLSRYLDEEAGAYNYADYSDEIDAILKQLIKYNVAMEVNTGGYRSRQDKSNPKEDVLKRYRELGGELITIGADGHTPRQIAFGFDRVSELLLKCGYRYYALYRQKKPEFMNLVL
ncbi:histidinol-phosphatase HisJ family protein [Blautia liquoris]|jgi:histidinol-phosphatase (PHP family)|uniref:Histidinol-phosphatase n=1 Tax=Blautia liquoris TaxID=2779518 RepID=A0A7M2RKC5_9FIRM|nr:histidinol-phosphatase HisJ family protein [Blautia liquoris]QOV20017.1 histidinol-phosphatase HisJ family protein [Blautia liquoris]